MLILKYSKQPSDAEPYCDLISEAMRSAQFTRVDVAVAYATYSGVSCLLDSFSGPVRTSWRTLQKRWLIGIDWCRTDPSALAALSQMPRATVRIHDGQRVSQRAGCVPALPFHPKVFILSGCGNRAVISGSGNLSKNGLSKGHEVGQLLLSRPPLISSERAIAQSLTSVQAWFNALWPMATDAGAIKAAYDAQYSARLRNPTPVDEDAVSDATLRRRLGSRRLSGEDIAKLRAARTLWIDSGNLHHNLGKGKPGNQLMMSPMTRVFFGFEPLEVETDTKVGDVSIQYGSGSVIDRPLRYSNNSMDVLALPMPGTAGPAAYDQQTLVFKKTVLAGNLVFRLYLAKKVERRSLETASNNLDSLYSMTTSGRKWGVC